MKSVALIFSVLLSFLLGDGTGDATCDRTLCADAIIECADQNSTDNMADLNDVAVLPFSTVSSSVIGGSLTPSARSSNSGKRVQPSSKSGYRVIKEGKVFDRNDLYTFQAVLLQFQSGMHSNSRYIHSICHLLI